MATPQRRSRKQPKKVDPHSEQAVVAALQRIARNPMPSVPPARTLTAGAGTLEQIGHEADMAWAGVKRIMSLLNVEKKQKIVTVGGTNVNYNGYILDLAGTIAQGVTSLTRVGDSLKIMEVRLKANFVVNTTTTTVTAVLGHSKDVVPNLGDVFNFTGIGQSGMNFPQSLQLADKWSKASTFMLDTVRNPTHLIDYKVKFNHDVTYSPGTTTVLTGDVWFAAISDVAPAGTPPVVQIACEIFFVDN